MGNALPMRKRQRLSQYDYSWQGAYFLTICTFQKQPLFGSIHNEVTVLSEAGEIISYWWQELPKRFNNIQLDSFVVMPDHFHALIHITIPSESIPLPAVIDWFKTMTTNTYIRGVKEGRFPRFQRLLWQRGFYDHVIRGEDDLARVREYILNNPMALTLEREQIFLM